MKHGGRNLKGMKRLDRNSMKNGGNNGLKNWDKNGVPVEDGGRK